MTTLQRELKFNICKLQSSLLADSKVTDLEERRRKYMSPELLYSATFWFEHLCQSKSEAACAGPDETSMARDLLCTERALFWLEVMSLTNKLSAAHVILSHIESNAFVCDLQKPSLQIGLTQ